MKFDLSNVLGMIGAAAAAVKTVKEQIDQAKETGAVLTTADEAQLEAAIAELEGTLPALRASTQNKLRGTG